MLTVYVVLKKVFHSVHREALWELPRLLGIHASTIVLLSVHYYGSESAVKCGGVRQGCVLAPLVWTGYWAEMSAKAMVGHP